jgi:hypothetical protein
MNFGTYGMPKNLGLASSEFGAYKHINIQPQIKSVRYNPNGRYEGVFYEIGSKLNTEPYQNPCYFPDQFKIGFSYDTLLSNNPSLSPIRLFDRPSDLNTVRNPYHSENGGTTFTISLPSGFSLKLSGVAMQKRNDFHSIHTSEFTITGFNIDDYKSLLGTFSTSFISNGLPQFFVNSTITTSNYFNTFTFTRTANTDGGVYFTTPFLELFGDLKVYQ